MKKNSSANLFSNDASQKTTFYFLAFFRRLICQSSLLGREFTRPNLDFKAGKFELKKNFDLIYGLDLAGGSHLVFEAESSQIAEEKRKTAIEGVRDVIERRVNLFGISEPNVQASSFEGKDRIIVELPGIKDTKEAAKLIGKTAQLVFAEIQGEGENAKLMLADLTGADLKSAKEIFDNTTGKPAVSLEFTQEGGKKFATLTERNVGKQLPIILDSQPLTSPVVQETITQG